MTGPSVSSRWCDIDSCPGCRREGPTSAQVAARMKTFLYWRRAVLGVVFTTALQCAYLLGHFRILFVQAPVPAWICAVSHAFGTAFLLIPHVKDLLDLRSLRRKEREAWLDGLARDVMDS